MQGAIVNEAEPNTILEIINDKYKSRPPFSEFAKLESVSPPASLDQFLEKIRFNANKFVFYYACVFVILNFVFILANNFFVIPIAVTVLSLFLFAEPRTVNGFEIKPLYSLVGCVVFHLLLCVFFGGVTRLYIYFFALNAFVLGVIVLHGAFIDTMEEDTGDI
jgi:PRA1 family protein